MNKTRAPQPFALYCWRNCLSVRPAHGNEAVIKMLQAIGTFDKVDQFVDANCPADCRERFQIALRLESVLIHISSSATFPQKLTSTQWFFERQSTFLSQCSQCYLQWAGPLLGSASDENGERLACKLVVLPQLRNWDIERHGLLCMVISVLAVRSERVCLVDWPAHNLLNA